jgi:hypothetical protein
MSVPARCGVASGYIPQSAPNRSERCASFRSATSGALVDCRRCSGRGTARRALPWTLALFGRYVQAATLSHKDIDGWTEHHRLGAAAAHSGWPRRAAGSGPGPMARVPR